MEAYEIVRLVELLARWQTLEDIGYSTEVIKRVLGVDGRTPVAIDDEGKVFVDGEEVEVTVGQLPIFISVYTVVRLYGGPEEGGWYYDHRTLMLTECHFLDEGAKIRFQELKEKYSNEGKRPLSSVLSDGIYDVMYEFKSGTYATKERPVYC